MEFNYESVKEGIPNVKKQMAVLNAEFKKSSEEAKASGKEIDNLGVRYDYLSNKIKIQEKDVEAYRVKLEKARNAQGNNTKAVENATASLQMAEAKLTQTRAGLDKVSKELEYQQNIIDKNSTEWKDLEYQLELTSAEYQKSSAEAKMSGKAVNELSAEHKSLTDTLKTQEKQVLIIKEKLQESTTAENKNEEAIRYNRLELAKAEGQLAQTKVEIDRVNKELENQKTTLGKTSDEWKNLSEKTTETGKSLSLKLTTPLLAAGAASFKLGADFEDAFGKAKVVFGDNANAIKDWSKTALTEFGLSSETALSMATDFAAGFSQMGVAMDKSTVWSKNLAERVNDLATYYNASIEETQHALTAILSGQTEPLKKFNIFMTQASLQTFAYTKGLKKSISEMTEAEKVQLRYDYVMEKTAKAHGNFKREQEGATAQLNLFKEGLKEVGVNFSEHILPIFTPILTWINDLIKKVANLSDGTKKFIVVVGGLAAVAGPILIVLGKVFKAISNITEGIGAIPKAIKGVGKAGKLFKGLLDDTSFLGFVKWAAVIIGVALAIAALVTAINYLIGRGEEMTKFSKNMSDMVSQVNTSVSGAGMRGYAVGTKYHPGGPALVGEEGPEIVDLPRGSRVHTAQETRQMLNGSGDTYILQVNMDEVDEVSKLMRVFNDFKQAKKAGVVRG